MPQALNGLRVVSFESRRSAEMAELIRNYGGEPIQAPAMREVPLTDQREALAFGETLLAGDWDILILLTGVGTRMLIAACATRWPKDEVSRRREIVEFALHNGLPTASPGRAYAQSGALFGYGPDLRVVAERAATYVDKIFKGAKPADLPVEQPTKFELIINLKTAKALGLTIPSSLLLRADQIIE